MHVNVLPSKTETGSAAATHAAKSLQRILSNADTARIIAATGASQLDFLQFLTANIRNPHTRRIEPPVKPVRASLKARCDGGRSADRA